MFGNLGIERYAEYLTFVRQKIHALAEVAWQEKNTLDFLLRQAKELNCQVFEEGGCLGLFFDFGKSKTVLLRAEMDALPIEEKTQLPFACKSGNMHACGHDGHCAMALGLAKYLSDLIDSGLPLPTSVNLLIVFQPAEEAEGGANHLLQREFVKNLQFDCGFALHLFPALPKGRFFSRAGAMLAGTKEVKITFCGEQGHIAFAEGNGRVLKGASEFLLESCEHKDGFLRFCKVQGGVATNVTCGEITLVGSMRFFEERQGEVIFDKVNDKAKKICKKHRLTYRCEQSTGIPPTVTEGEVLKKIRKYRRVQNSQKVFIGDDFGLYAKKMPVAYFLLGTGGEWGLHSCFFDFDERLLCEGLDFCLDFLKSRGQ